MHHIVFIPGIMGSRLALNDEEVWPPKIGEVLGGYSRIDKLVDPAVKSTGIIESQCVPFYGPLLDALRDAGAGEDGAEARLTAWDYDWRLDLRQTSDALAKAFDQVVATDPAARISIVCHSMGGLVTRGCLEAPAHSQATWQPKVQLVLFLATPHDGAPLALSRLLGIGGSSLGLSATQLQKLGNDERYPSGYQLLPDENEPVTWRMDGLDPFTGQSIGQLVASGAHGLSANSLTAARDFRTRLDHSRRNAATRYFSVVSASHATATRFDGRGPTLTQVETKSSGDGTVPIRSGAALPVQTGFVVADHVGVATSTDAHTAMLMLLGLEPVGPVPLAGRGPAMPTLSVSPMMPAQDEPWEIVAAFPENTSAFHGEVRVVRDGATQHVIPISITTESLTTIVLDGPSLAPGLYDIVLRAGEAPSQTVPLVVSAPVSGALP